MDFLIPLYSGLAAILGALVVALGNFLAQRIAQRNENIRHSKNLAYEFAFQEWKFVCETRIDTARQAGVGCALPPLGAYQLYSLAFDKFMGELDMATASGADIVSVLEKLRARHDELVSWWEKEAQERHGAR